jgi:hypothetical protein
MLSTGGWHSYFLWINNKVFLSITEVDNFSRGNPMIHFVVCRWILDVQFIHTLLVHSSKFLLAQMKRCLYVLYKYFSRRWPMLTYSLYPCALCPIIYLIVLCNIRVHDATKLSLVFYILQSDKRNCPIIWDIHEFWPLNEKDTNPPPPPHGDVISSDTARAMFPQGGIPSRGILFRSEAPPGHELLAGIV